MKKKIVIIVSLLVFTLLFIFLLYRFNYIMHAKYTNDDFDIKTYISDVDMDNDGEDDQSDILDNVYRYIAKKPKYKSKYYANGYPDDNYGVCTDVVAFGLLDAGYDLKELVNQDINDNSERYNIKTIDKNIDFRRVVNLNIYFKYNSINLTTDISKISEWQGGDIVVFKNHIGIVSDKRNSKGIPFVIHHANPFQRYYEEDILGSRYDIIGHYRVS